MPGKSRPTSMPPASTTTEDRRKNGGVAVEWVEWSAHGLDQKRSKACSRPCASAPGLQSCVDPVAQLGAGVGQAVRQALGSEVAGLSGRHVAHAVQSASEAFVHLAIALSQGAEELVVVAADVAMRAPDYLANAPIITRFSQRPLHEVTPMIMVAIIMGTFYFSYAVCCVPLGSSTTFDLANVSFHITFILAMVSYHNGVATDPGGVPESWSEAPDVLDRIDHYLVERKKTTGQRRFCHKELKYKPDRAHFCRQLSRNVLRMDHYCPWMSNCVGHYNHKFFFLFLLYTVISTNITMFSLVQALVNKIFPAGTTVVMLQSAGMAAFLSAVLTPFFVFHCWLLSRNMTTIEFCEQKGWEKHSLRKSPYDLGMFNNFRSVLGEHLWLWPLPVGAPQGDGLSWNRSPNFFN